MEILNQTFTNRELAILLWIFIAIIAAMFLKSFRGFLTTTAKVLGDKRFAIIFITLIIYILGVIFLLRSIKLWGIGNIKDTVFWLFFAGFALIFNAVQTTQTSYFKQVLSDAIKWTVILEFIVNFYTFGILVEFIMIPIIVFIGLTQVVSKMDNKNVQVTNLLKNILSIIGWLYLCFAAYMTLKNIDNFLAFATLTSFLLPILLTVLFLPFIYFISLYSTYENFFTSISFMTTDKKKVNKVKKLILRVANFSLSKLYRIKQDFNKKVFYEETNMKAYLIAISKKNR